MATSADRKNSLLNTVKPMLGVFTNLQVWEEKARPTSVLGVYSLNYKNLTDFQEEVRWLDDTLLSPTDGSYTIDRVNGKLTITDTSTVEGSDYFVTYRFNYFADVDLGVFVDAALAQINATAEQDTHLNNYTLDTAPPNWDGPMMLFIYMRALETLLMDSVIWKNFLIFQDGAAAQGLLEAEIGRTKQTWDELRRSVKRVHILKRPTSAYEMFRITGIGSFKFFSSRLRGFRSNRFGVPDAG